MIMELSGEFPVKLLCETMGIQRSSFYSWKKHLSDPSDRTRAFVSNILLFQEYHLKYPSHGYRWLNAKIAWTPVLPSLIPMLINAAKQPGSRVRPSITDTRNRAILSVYFPICFCLKCRSTGHCNAL